MGKKKFLVFGSILILIFTGGITALSSTTFAEETPIPNWIRDTALWWGEGKISDGDFINAIQYLMEEKILNVPAPDSSSEEIVEKEINFDKLSLEITGIEEVNEAFKKVDLLIGPTVPVLPFKLGAKIEDPVALFLVDTCTVTANLTGKPAITIPFEFANGLPIGIQILAKALQDKLVLQAGRALEKTRNLPKEPILK